MNDHRIARHGVSKGANAPQAEQFIELNIERYVKLAAEYRASGSSPNARCVVATIKGYGANGGDRRRAFIVGNDTPEARFWTIDAIARNFMGPGPCEHPSISYQVMT